MPETTAPRPFLVPSAARPDCVAPPRPLPPLTIGRRANLSELYGAAAAPLLGRDLPAPDWIEPDRQGHLMTIAPTGAGKGAGHLIPALLTWPGPAVVLDVKGEAFASTARARREMGQEVVLLDPFGLFPEVDQGAFNPLDLLDPEAVTFQEDCAALAARICPSPSVKDPFWDDSARQMVAGLIAYVVARSPKALRNLGEVCFLAHQPDKDLELTLREAARQRNTVVRQGLAQLAGAEPRVRASIVSTAQRFLPTFGSAQVAAALSGTSFDPQRLVDGAPMTLYLVIPPHRLDTAAPLLRVWLGALMGLFQSRSLLPDRETLFLVDEAWHLGHLPELERATTLMRGYGLRLWSFWQDLDQITQRYPDSHATLINNTATICGFGFHNPGAQALFAMRLGLPGWAQEGLDPGEALLHRAGRMPERLRLTRYYDTPAFDGRWDVNPLAPRPGTDPRR